VKQAVRWGVAGLVTVVAFCGPAWICGALVLPTLITDPVIRWGIAGALGVALAALAALWGKTFATEGRPAAGSGDVHNEISGGTFHAPVSLARDITGPVYLGASSPNPDPPGTGAAAASPPARTGGRCRIRRRPAGSPKPGTERGEG
jgi:hypothetical protein